MLDDSWTHWDVNVLSPTKEAAIGSWGAFVFTIFRYGMDIDVAMRLSEAVDDVVKSHPDGIGILTIIKQGAQFPTQEARHFMAEKLRHIKIAGSATVVESDGLHAAAVHGTVNCLVEEIRQQHPHQNFSDLADACSWLVSTVLASPGDWMQLPKQIQLENAIDDFISMM